MAFMKNQLQLMKKSFSLTKKTGITLLFDVCYYAIFIAIAFALFTTIEQKVTEFQLPNSVLDLSEQEIVTLTTNVQQFYFMLLAIITAFVILAILNLSFWKGLIWNTTMKKKNTLQFFKRFFLRNVLWICTSLAIFIAISAFLLKPTAVFAFGIMYFILLIYISTLIFYQEANVKQPILKSLRNAANNIPKTILPFTFTLFGFYIVFTVFKFIHGIAVGIALLVYLTWSRNYMIAVQSNK